MKKYITFLLLFPCMASCGVFSKTAKHTKHEAHQQVSIATGITVVTETTITGDSAIEIAATSLQTIVPFAIDTNSTNSIDSVVSDAVKVYYQPVYHIADNGKMVIKGLQIKAVTPAKTIRPNYTQTQRTSIAQQAKTAVQIDTVSTQQVQVVKRNNRLGGIVTLLITITLLCVGLYIIKQTAFKH